HEHLAHERRRVDAPHEQPLLLGVVEADDAVLLDRRRRRVQVDRTVDEAESPQEARKRGLVAAAASRTVALSELGREGLFGQQVDGNRLLELQPPGLLDEGLEGGEYRRESRRRRRRLG